MLLNKTNIKVAQNHPSKFGVEVLGVVIVVDDDSTTLQNYSTKSFLSDDGFIETFFLFVPRQEILFIKIIRFGEENLFLFVMTNQF